MTRAELVAVATEEARRAGIFARLDVRVQTYELDRELSAALLGAVPLTAPVRLMPVEDFDRTFTLDATKMADALGLQGRRS
jgi:hypothetical protein